MHFIISLLHAQKKIFTIANISTIIEIWIFPLYYNLRRHSSTVKSQINFRPKIENCNRKNYNCNRKNHNWIYYCPKAKLLSKFEFPAIIWPMMSFSACKNQNNSGWKLKNCNRKNYICNRKNYICNRKKYNWFFMNFMKNKSNQYLFLGDY